MSDHQQLHQYAKKKQIIVLKVNQGPGHFAHQGSLKQSSDSRVRMDFLCSGRTSRNCIHAYEALIIDDDTADRTSRRVRSFREPVSVRHTPGPGLRFVARRTRARLITYITRTPKRDPPPTYIHTVHVLHHLVMSVPCKQTLANPRSIFPTQEHACA